MSVGSWWLSQLPAGCTLSRAGVQSTPPTGLPHALSAGYIPTYEALLRAACRSPELSLPASTASGSAGSNSTMAQVAARKATRLLRSLLLVAPGSKLLLLLGEGDPREAAALATALCKAHLQHAHGSWQPKRGPRRACSSSGSEQEEGGSGGQLGRAAPCMVQVVGRGCTVRPPGTGRQEGWQRFVCQSLLDVSWAGTVSPRPTIVWWDGAGPRPVLLMMHGRSLMIVDLPTGSSELVTRCSANGMESGEAFLCELRPWHA